MKYVWFSENNVLEIQKLYVNADLILGKYSAKIERKNC